ncbi:ABC transporter substrate-binding protein [Saccharibacillus sp. JS10]|uniref:ABC transporter substrate-binding protein n=1 Tax=Saccharibacillus sp. JS10 TaxID=2950552 RepID=UPI00210C9863|nr:extracellular solute-binding protein [Saccharibacillus sp. JS10]MCQ4086082.1 extracellular solute-binding protein [Saccharibacillus sp. JS10]
MKNFSWKKIAAALATVILLPGCFSGGSEQPSGKTPSKPSNGIEQKPSNEQGTLRIGILTGAADDRYYRETYTDIYEYMNPDLNIEIVPAIDTDRYRYLDPDAQDYKKETPLSELQKLADGQVDVWILDPEMLRSVTQKGWAEPLAPYMQRTGESESDFAPAAINGLKDLGDGELYALTPDYASSALYYNVDWFEKNNVKLPEDGMTWDEAFALARAASGEDEQGEPLYGLSFTQTLEEDPLWAIRAYTDPLGLSTFDLESEQMTVDTPEWLDAWTVLTNLSQQGAIPLALRPGTDPDHYDVFGGDLFLGEKTAMTIADSSYAANLQTATRNADRIPDFKPFRWGTVTLPVHPGKEGIGSGVQLGDTFSIASSSTHKEQAWEFIRFVTSERIQEMGLHDVYRMPSRLQAIDLEAEERGYRSQAFTQLRPSEPIAKREEEAVQSNSQLWQIGNTGKELFQRVLQGQISPKQALEQWENDGSRWLKGPFTDDGTLTFVDPLSPNIQVLQLQDSKKS